MMNGLLPVHRILYLLLDVVELLLGFVNLLLAARAMGLGASLITLPLWSVTSARRILGLPLTVTPVCVVPLGWPRGRYGPTTRKPVDEVIHLDSYGNRAWKD